jgi:hypothetical protein
MKKYIVIMLLLSAMVFGVSPSAQDAATTFRNGYAWTGNVNDNATAWAQAVEAEADGAIGTGKTFYVDSGVSASGNGTSWSQAKSTLDAAIALCTANRGDKIYVAQGHAETNSATGALVTCDIAGVTIIGMGSGTTRPTITLSHVTAAAFTTTAANVTIANIYIDSTGVDSVASSIIVAEDHTTIVGCEFLMADGTGQADSCITTSGAANLCDYLTVSNCRFVSPNAGAAEAILLEEVEEGVVIEGCYIYGDFSVAGIHNPTGKVCTNVLIKGCTIKNDQTGDMCIELVSACTGFLIGNYYHGDTDAALVDPGSCFSYECYGADTVDTSGFLLPAAGSAT